MKIIWKNFCYDPTLPILSRVVVMSTIVGSILGLYMLFYSESFEVVSIYYLVNKLLEIFFIGIFLLVPLVIVFVTFSFITGNFKLCKYFSSKSI